jgi:hypothetical protein
MFHDPRRIWLTALAAVLVAWWINGSGRTPGTIS